MKQTPNARQKDPVSLAMQFCLLAMGASLWLNAAFKRHGLIASDFLRPVVCYGLCAGTPLLVDYALSFAPNYREFKHEKLKYPQLSLVFWQIGAAIAALLALIFWR